MKMKAFCGGLAILLAGTALPLAAVTPSSAASTPQIQRIATAKAYDGGKTTIRPRFKKGTDYDVTSAHMTVKQGKRTIAKNKKSVSLKAGTYRVTQTLNFRKFTWLEKRSTIGPREVTTSDYAKWDDDLGDFVNNSYCQISSKQAIQNDEWDVTYKHRVWCYIPSLSAFRLYGGFESTYESYYRIGDRVEDYEPVLLDRQTAVKRSKKYGKSFTKKKTQRLVIKRGNSWCTSDSELRQLKLGMTKSQVRRITGDKGSRYSGKGANETRMYERCYIIISELLPEYDFVYVKYKNGRASSIKYYSEGRSMRSVTSRLTQPLSS